MSNENLFKAFICVAEVGSISKASERLFVSQPALTKSIKQLENELGGQLFERKSRGVVLTTSGKYIYDRVKPLMDEVDDIYKYFDNVNKLKTGVLRIGTTTSNINFLLSHTLNKFITKFPNIEIKIRRGEYRNLISQLKNHEIDLAVLDGEQVKPDLKIVKSYSVSYNVVGNNKFNNKFLKKSLTREEFAKQPLALIGKAHTSRTNIDSYFAKYNINLAPKYEMENYGLIIDLIKKGVAIGIVNPEYFETELEKKEIFVLKTDFEMEKRTIAVVEVEQSENNPAKEQFIKLL